MEVEDLRASRPRAPESVPGARRRREEDSRTGADDVFADRELDLAVEDVERIGVIRMRVRIDGEARVELDLAHGELWQSALDRDPPVTALEPLAACGARNQGVVGRPSPLVRRD